MIGFDLSDINASDTVVYLNRDGSYSNSPEPGVSYHEPTENRAQRRARRAQERREIKRLTKNLFEEM